MLILGEYSRKVSVLNKPAPNTLNEKKTSRGYSYPKSVEGKFVNMTLVICINMFNVQGDNRAVTSADEPLLSEKVG